MTRGLLCFFLFSDFKLPNLHTCVYEIFQLGLDLFAQIGIRIIGYIAQVIWVQSVQHRKEYSFFLGKRDIP
jgi:hypothetical protein